MAAIPTPGMICRMPPSQLLADPERGQSTLGSVMGTVVTLVIGTLAYGFSFGLWRAPEQGLYSAIKMPALFLSIIGTTTLINGMIAPLLGVPIRLRQTLRAMLYAMAITASILGAFAPVVVFVVLQIPPPLPSALGKHAMHPDVQTSMAVFWPLLLSHIVLIACAGVTGCLRLRSVLRAIAPSRAKAARVLAVWIVVTGFVGGELSWLFSPFLCKPDFPPHFIARTYQEGNFYEQVYRGIRSVAF